MELKNVKAEMSQSRWSGRGRLDDLVNELRRQAAARFDFCVDARAIRVAKSTEFDSFFGDNTPYILLPIDSSASDYMPLDGYPLKKEALFQLARSANPSIPTKFIEGLTTEYPSIAIDLMNDLLHANANRHFIRVLDNEVRAFLSDKYRVIDHHGIAMACLSAAQNSGGDIVECTLTDRKMRIKFTSREIYDSLNLKRTGDKGSWYAGGLGNQDWLSKVAATSTGELPGGPGTVHPLITISNSETGFGGFNVRFGILMAICYNLATVEQVAQNIHLGARIELGVYSAETVSAESKAILLKASDAVKAAFNDITFRRICNKLKDAQEREIEEPTDAVENIVNICKLSDEDEKKILEYFLRDYDQTLFGLGQSVARRAQDIENADKAAEFEQIAGNIMTGVNYHKQLQEV